MDEKEMITVLDDLYSKAHEIYRSFSDLNERQRFRSSADPKALVINHVYGDALTLMASLNEATSMLKRGRADHVKGFVTEWYHHRVELDVEVPQDPTYEQVGYLGKDRWEVIMFTPTHGREKLVVDSDTLSLAQVYSAEKV